MISEKIDAVFLWCDGADPKFRRAKDLMLKKMGLPFDEDNVGDVRFEDNEELRYALRSVSINAPWVNHIWVVTNGQRPYWLIENNRLTVVCHDEIIPAELLPTFNSVVIEMYVHRIPGLQEKYILFNDDFFIKNKVSPDFFFNGDLPVVRLRRERTIRCSCAEAEKIINEHSVSAFRETQLRAWISVCKKYGEKELLVLAHVADGMTKTAVEHTLKKYPEILKTNISPFRTGREIQRLIFQLEMIYGLGAELRIQRRANIIDKYLWFVFNKPLLESYEGAESDRTRKRILHYNPILFCLNASKNIDIENKIRSRVFLERIFAVPSPFEK